MTPSKFIKRVLGLVTCMVMAVAFNAAAGATCAVAIGCAPEAGAIAGNVLALAMGHAAPTGALRAGVLTEIWTGEMIKAFRTAPEALGWMQRIRSYNQYVNQDVIHFVAIGGDPAVLVDNTTYPLAITALTDADKPISLSKFSTEATPVTDDELHALSYDKMASVQERHRDALREKIAQRAIHSIAPDKQATDVPVINTTGASDGTRKKMTFADLLTLKREFDKMGIPGNDRVLVLCSDHVNDLLETEQKFKEHYNINQTEGKVCRLYGFDIYEYDGTPYYTMSTGVKLAWGALPKATDARASVAFYAGRMMKAYEDKASVSGLGIVLGLLSRAKVHQSIAWVKEFPTGVSVPAFGDGTKLRDLDRGIIDKLDKGRYLFFVTHTGQAGSYMNDSHNMDAAISDYAAIESVRTMDKAVRGIRTYIIPELAGNVYVDAGTGKLASYTVEHLKTTANHALEDMERAGELSGCRVDIDTEQDILSTGEVEFVIGNVPVGVMRHVKVKIGFVKSV